MRIRGLLITLALLIMLSTSTAVSATEAIGTPCSDKAWFARNLWDMTFYDGRLFVGCGDSRSNAGPIDIWSYDPQDGWTSEFQVDEEQIDRFLMLDGVLTIPGDDALESWTFGNYYQRIDGAWTKIRNIPSALHVYDIVQWDGQWIAGLGVNVGGAAVAVSSNQGQSWQQMIVPIGAENLQAAYAAVCQPRFVRPVERVYNLFTIGDQLYANMPPYTVLACVDGQETPSYKGVFAQWTSSGLVEANLDLFAGLTADRVVRVVYFGSDTVYIAALTVDLGKWQPVALMRVGADLQASPVTPPDCERPQDLEVVDGALYVLCNQPYGAIWTMSIERTCDYTTWETVAALRTLTFARSFAFAPDAIYVGLGGDRDTHSRVQRAVGTVIQIPTQLGSDCSGGG